MTPTIPASCAAPGNTASVSFLKRLTRWIVLFALLALPRLHAQSTGAIEGRVFNPATGEYLRNAEVRLQGTERIVATENDGTFRLDNVPAGQATITVTYVGYNTATETFTVSTGQTATREINLSSAAYGSRAGDTIKMGEFVVSSEREGNAKAIMAQRRNMNISTSVASDIFGDVSEGNIGEFLKYLPGVDVEYQDAEVRGPRIGGLSGEYVGVTMDGARFASADALGSYNGFINAPDAGRSMGFEQLSISSIESIEITRTNSADMDADSPAGNINLKSRRGFDRKGRRIDWQFSITGVSDDFKWGKTTRPGDRQNHLVRPSTKIDYSDVFFNHRLGVSLGLSQSKILVEQQSVTHTLSRTTAPTDTRPLVVTGIAFGDGPKFVDRDTAALNLDFKASSRLVLALTTMWNTYSGATFSRSLSWTAANANANVNIGRVTIGGDGLTEIRTNGLATNTARVVSIGGGQNFDKKTQTITLNPRFEYNWNRLQVDGSATYSRSKNDYQSLPDSIRTHTTNDLGGIDFRATRPSYNSAEWTIVQTAGPDWANLANYTNPRISSNEDRGELVKIYEASLNVRYNLPFEHPTFVKFGGKVNEQYRKSYNRNGGNAFSYIGPGGNSFVNGVLGTNGSFANFVSPRLDAGDRGPEISLNVANMPRHPNRQELGSAVIAHPEWFVNTATVANYYDAFYGSIRDFKQSVPALYGMANTRFGPLQLQGGVRWENSETISKEWDPIPGAQLLRQGIAIDANRRATTRAGIDYQFGSRPRVKRVGEYDNFFPTVSAKYSFNPNLQAQAGYHYAISRPPVSTLAGVWVINDTATPPTVNAPNPNLLPETIDNYTARLAYYFEPVGSFTFLVQQVEIKNVRTSFRYSADEFGVDDPAYDGYEFISTINGQQMFRYRSMEFGYNQALSFLPGPLKNTNLNLSYTRSYANQRRPGLVPHKISGSVGWNYWRLNLRISALWQDDSQWTTTAGRFQRHWTKYDLNAGIRLTNRISLFAQGRNVLNSPRTQYDPNPGTNLPPVLQAMFNYGVSWVFGVKGNF